MGDDDNTKVPFGRVDCKPNVLCSDFLRCQTLRQSSKESVQGSRVLRGLKKQDSRGGGEGVPTDLRGKLTESQLRKSKNLAKRRLQKKRHSAEPCESDKFSENATAERPNEKKNEKATLCRSLRKRHFAECCESDKDGSKSAKIPVNRAEACGELRRAPARPGGKTKGPQPGQLHAPWPTSGGGETTGARSDYTALGRGSAAVL